MSQQETAQVVQKVYDSFNTEDIGGLSSTFTGDIVWSWPFPSLRFIGLVEDVTACPSSSVAWRHTSSQRALLISGRSSCRETRRRRSVTLPGM